MTRKIRMTIEVELDDLPEDERAECKEIEGEVLDEDGNPLDLPRLADYDLDELVGPIGNDLEAHNDTIWEGSGVYARIVSSKIIEATEVA